MPEPDGVAGLIDRIVAGARIPRRAQREDLRRELWSHFEEADGSPDDCLSAIRRFGAEAAVTESLRRVYRWDYCVLYVAKIAASIIASFAAALLLVAAANVRVELATQIWQLAPDFARAARLSLAVALALVVVTEATRPPFSRTRAAVVAGAYAAICALMQAVVAHSARAFTTAAVIVLLGYLCSRLESRPARWLLTFAAFAVTEYALHSVLSVAIAPAGAALASARLVAVWASTVVILARIDQAFARMLEAPAG
jgi:hypothetical protein